MEERLQRETECLIRSWARHDEQTLGTYLVADVEDPRINVQSVLTRHFLIVALFGKRFEKLLEQEMRFALVMNWAHLILEQAGGIDDLRAIRHALAAGADDAEGWAIPGFISTTFRGLPARFGEIAISDYLGPVLDQGSQPRRDLSVDEQTLGTFQRIWAKALEREAPMGLSVLEPACGSANDYRCLNAYGLARLIDYTGFDLCPKNIDNARSLFPQARFEVGNAFAMSWPDLAFDHTMVHDLFEHLSIEGMESALCEVGRVTRRSLSIGFFNLHEGEEHIVRPTGEYHWNMLSVPRLRQFLERRGFEARVIHIDTFLRWRFGCDQAHNKNAYTFFAERV